MSAPAELHPLLLRLLKRCKIDVATDLTDPRWLELSKRVSRTLVDNDEDRYLRERSLDISSREMQELNTALAAERLRLQGELEVARNLQTSLLPRDLTTPRFEVAGRMVPATEVGGDYYDVLPFEGGAWIAIGDVAGHGLRAAVIMTMVQSMTAALIRQDPSLAPREVMVALNQGVRENVFRRMGARNHVTMTLFRCTDDGNVTFAGAHEPILVHRAATKTCDEIETHGTWLGPMEDIGAVTEDHNLHLAAGDLMVLHTDGITEARNATNGLFGLERLTACVDEAHASPVATLCDGILATVREWIRIDEDDLSLLAYRRLA